MSWPLSQDYNEAIQDPANSFSDADLKTGEAVSNALGIPMPRSGNFADVYEVRCPSGSRWAVKCFTREVSGLRERYAEIGKYLRLAKQPFMVDFQYLEQGIRVRGQWYPILKMQWVEGFLLNEFVRDNLDKKPILQALGHIWLKMARRLRESYIAHCDLQHGNVLFVPGNKSSSLAVKLIDYDGMCVPSLVGTKSGEVGHPAYQHPERLRSGAYDQEVDRFALLSIGTALRCLALGGRFLWERYDTGDNLLFRQADFQAPADSPLFQELLTIDDPQTQKLVTELIRACQAPLDAVPLLTDLLPEEKPAGKVTKTVAASSSVVAPQTADAQGPDWDFGGEEPSTSIVKKRRASGGMPMWVWGAMGGAAAMVLAVGVSVGLVMHKGPDDNKGTPLAQNKPETDGPKQKTKTPPKERSEEAANPVDPPANAVKLPPTPAKVASSPADVVPSKRILLLSPAADSLAISQEGDKTWRLINYRTGAVIRAFRGHEGAVVALAFSADGRRAVSSDDVGKLRLWDVQTGEPIGTHKAQRLPLVGLTLSPDGTKAAYANDGLDVQMWSFETKTEHRYPNGRKVSAVAFSPDGRYLVMGYHQSAKPEDMVLFVWPLAGGLVGRRLNGPSKTVNSIAVSPDGKYVAAGRSGDPVEIAIWDVDSQKPPRIMRLLQRSRVRQVLFSPDSRLILAACGTSILLFGRDGSFLHSYPGRDPLITAAFSPDGKQVLHASRHQGKILHGAFQVPQEPITQPPPPLAAPPSVVANPPIDPDHDCKFEEADGKLTITVPAKTHFLNADGSRKNSPRVLFDIEGDFTVRVRVGGNFTPVPSPGTKERKSWIGAGLLLWVDEDNFFRLERVRLHDGKTWKHANWEGRLQGKQREKLTMWDGLKELKEAKTYLQLERRDRQLLASFCEEGQNWTKAKPLDIELPPKVKIGVLAGSSSKDEFAPTFDKFQIKQGNGKWVAIDKWLPPADTVAEKPPQPSEQSEAWWSHLKVPPNIVPSEKDGVLRIPVPREIATRQEYSGPLDITVVVRGPQNHDVSFFAAAGAIVTLRNTGRQGHVLNVHRPDDPRGKSGTFARRNIPITLPDNQWCTLYWQIKSTGMKVSIDGKEIFQEEHAYNLNEKYPVKIRVNSATVEVKSVVVRSAKQ